MSELSLKDLLDQYDLFNGIKQSSAEPVWFIGSDLEKHVRQFIDCVIKGNIERRLVAMTDNAIGQYLQAQEVVEKIRGQSKNFKSEAQSLKAHEKRDDAKCELIQVENWFRSVLKHLDLSTEATELSLIHI